MRTRKFSESNYSSIYINGKTLRIPLDPKKQITELAWPEFYDIGINSRCYGRCPYCYTSAISNGVNWEGVVDRIHSFFGGMQLEQRPYQVALGGSGEPTMHPDFAKVLEAFKSLQITPNYTTNGMHMTDEVLEATVKYSGGVALTLHKHLERHWRKAIEKLLELKVRTNVHIVVSDRASIDFTKEMYSQYDGRIDYFVMLPYMNTGFALNDPRNIDFDYFEQWLTDVQAPENIAFGSNFYPFLKRTKAVKVSLYPPEIMSKYLIMDEKMKLYNNSFEMKEVEYSFTDGVEIGKAAMTDI